MARMHKVVKGKGPARQRQAIFPTYQRQEALPSLPLIFPNLASDLGLESRPPPAAMIAASADKEDDEKDEAVVMEE